MSGNVFVGGVTMAGLEKKRHQNEVEEVLGIENAKTMTWHRRFLTLAKLVASWSKDPSSKVGAVIVDQNRRVISTGYNGFAVGVGDYAERLDNRDVKYKIILHAEENAIMFSKRDLTGCSLYVTDIPPCAHCASLIIQSGIKNVYALKRDVPERWKESFELTKSIFTEAMVDLKFIDMPEEKEEDQELRDEFCDCFTQQDADIIGVDVVAKKLVEKLYDIDNDSFDKNVQNLLINIGVAAKLIKGFEERS